MTGVGIREPSPRDDRKKFCRAGSGVAHEYNNMYRGTPPGRTRGRVPCRGGKGLGTGISRSVCGPRRARASYAARTAASTGRILRSCTWERFKWWMAGPPTLYSIRDSYHINLWPLLVDVWLAGAGESKRARACVRVCMCKSVKYCF